MQKLVDAELWHLLGCIMTAFLIPQQLPSVSNFYAMSDEGRSSSPESGEHADDVTKSAAGLRLTDLNPDTLSPTRTNSGTNSGKGVVIQAYRPGTTQTTSWSADSSTDDLGSRYSPRPFADIEAVIPRLRLGLPRTANQATHYTVKCLAPDESELDVKLSNVVPNESYYVDCQIDVQSSRSKSKSTSGYYDLLGIVSREQVSAGLAGKFKQHFTELLTAASLGKHELRVPVYISGDSVRMACRVWEKSDKPTSVHVLSDQDGKSVLTAEITTASPRFMTYTGKARLVFSLSVVTVTKTYAKVVANVTSIAIRSGSGSSVSGIQIHESPQSHPSTAPFGVSQVDWDSLIQMLREAAESGIPCHMLTGAIREALDTKIGKLSTPQQTSQVQQAQQQRIQQYTPHMHQQIPQHMHQQIPQQIHNRQSWQTQQSDAIYPPSFPHVSMGGSTAMYTPR